MNKNEMSVYDLIRSLNDEQLNCFIGWFGYTGQYPTCDGGFCWWDLMCAVETAYIQYNENKSEEITDGIAKELDEDLKKYYEQTKKKYN